MILFKPSIYPHLSGKLVIGLVLMLIGLIPYAQSINDSEQELFDGISDSETLIRQLNNDDRKFVYTSAATNVYLRQVGADNSAEVSQHGVDISAYVKQYQSKNYASIQQEGRVLFTGVIQNGTGNTIDLDLIGTRIATGVWQYGVQNSIDLDLAGDNMLYAIIQVGGNHSISQTANADDIGLGFNSKGLRIRQTGNGANLIIK